MTDTNENQPAIRRSRKMARQPQAAAAGEPPITAPAAGKKQPGAPTKASIVEGLLEGAEGASLDELCQVTGWQQHTCRAFLTGLRKKGRNLERCKREDGSTIYRLFAPQGAA